MKIVYIAKHGHHDNQDEDAITYALTKLGHEVECIYEQSRKRSSIRLDRLDGDFMLFHKWDDLGAIGAVNIPRIFWCFDQIHTNDPTLHVRAAQRAQWANNVTGLCSLGFCTDGDWVNRDETGKLHWLMQGADERYAGYGERLGEEQPPILFTGLERRDGQMRESCIRELRNRYGDRFAVLGNTRSTPRLHGRELANLFASVKIVIAPDGPGTHNYWSNRVYLTLGLGGFLIHPYSERLTKHYKFDVELACYSNRKELFEMIDWYVSEELPTNRQELRRAGHEATLARHTYRHRCEELIEIVKERL